MKRDISNFSSKNVRDGVRDTLNSYGTIAFRHKSVRWITSPYAETKGRRRAQRTSRRTRIKGDAMEWWWWCLGSSWTGVGITFSPSPRPPPLFSFPFYYLISIAPRLLVYVYVCTTTCSSTCQLFHTIASFLSYSILSRSFSRCARHQRSHASVGTLSASARASWAPNGRLC